MSNTASEIQQMRARINDESYAASEQIPRGNELDAIDRALEILVEFDADVRAAGLNNTQEEWPDLMVTWDKCQRFLRGDA
jgi:hypothetical protein